MVGAAMAVMMYRAPLDSVLQPVDDRWFDVMIDVRNDWLTDVANVLSVVGGPFAMFPALLVTVGLAFNRRWLQLGRWVSRRNCASGR